MLRALFVGALAFFVTVAGYSYKSIQEYFNDHTTLDLSMTPKKVISMPQEKLPNVAWVGRVESVNHSYLDGKANVVYLCKYLMPIDNSKEGLLRSQIRAKEVEEGYFSVVFSIQIPETAVQSYLAMCKPSTCYLVVAGVCNTILDASGKKVVSVKAEYSAMSAQLVEIVQ